MRIENLQEATTAVETVSQHDPLDDIEGPLFLLQDAANELEKALNTFRDGQEDRDGDVSQAADYAKSRSLLLHPRCRSPAR